MKYIITTILVVCTLSIILGQTEGYFTSPINYKIKMSGSFGELRNNHFHAGIDLKSSNGTSGDPIYAAAKGYVSRVKVQSGSYGNALYIDHPNGYTTVYAHLQAFTPEIEDLIKKNQYDLQSFEVDIYPEQGKYTFDQGEMIGKMGNTGRSYGPHLHFEIRNTKTEVPENPYLHGIGPEDHRAPLIQRVGLISYDSDLHEQSFWSVPIKGKASTHVLKKPLTANSNHVGITVKTYDRMDGASNLNGTYRITMYVNDSLYYESVMDRVSFYEMRYINSHIDYPRYKKHKSWYVRCHRLPGNTLNIYNAKTGSGIIHIDPEESKHIRIITQDWYGNASEVQFDVVMSAKDFESVSYNAIAHHSESLNVVFQNTRIKIPQGAIDRSYRINYAEDDASFSIGDEAIPLFKPMTIKRSLKGCTSKHIIVHNGKTNFGGDCEGDSLVTSVDAFGSFSVVYDSIPPSIELIHDKSGGQTIQLKYRIKDDYTARRSASEVQYDVFLDDQWELATYRALDQTLSFKKSGIRGGKHTVVIRARDHVGNMRTVEKTIIL